MRVLDLRPRTVRMMSSLWGRSSRFQGHHAHQASPPNPATRCVAKLADAFIKRRVSARSLCEGGPAIISVGNLALGGTGKTPVVAALAADLAASGLKGAVLTRGFGSPLAGPLTVDSGNVLAGDEARLMAAALSAHKWPVIQARRRTRGLGHLLEKFPATEVVIVEDGHQTAGLGRHLDVVILDGWTVTGKGADAKVNAVTGPVFPLGPWRESAAGADRAGIWLLETDQEVPAAGSGGQAVARFHRNLILRNPRGGNSGDLPAGRPGVLSGIARPEAFENSLEKVLNQEPVLAVRCGDHAQYTPRGVAGIVNALKEEGAGYLVTTVKDWVKLEPFWPQGLAALVADLEIKWGHDKALPELVGERLNCLLGR
jgi:tetraacyldisaccharide 4'-kinase